MVHTRFSELFLFFVYILIVLCLHGCPRAFSSCGEGGLLSRCGGGASMVGASLVGPLVF